MKENWMVNRIGLVDFWYYDDQEFTFINGRMLLRGSNGSGKSVTMQSVVPLLLDGNMRPERLDPFGSKDRKMSSYLLEEGDGREERIGYLYLELTKPGMKLFSTIGMGIRARRGKALDSWYFYISDGRRVNRDFQLYKEAEGKITLTQRELENRIGAGGRVLSSQAEYMDYVNRQFFGFETVDEYKEMIDLLIQLRTPKLSKDFKPSVINEILSDSLQPLSEEDLRPMSEAIENMDNLSTNLSNKQSSAQAAEKIVRQYEKYNQCIIREKAELYSKALEEQNGLVKAIERSKAELVTHAEQMSVKEEEKNRLIQEQKVREQEKETLNASDAVALKQREAEVAARLSDNENSRQNKENQLQAKQEKWNEYHVRHEKARDNAEGLSDKLTCKLQEMTEGLETVFVDEHAFFEQEFTEKRESEMNFDTHLTQLRRLMESLEAGQELLKNMEQQKKLHEEQLLKYDQEKKLRNSMERSIHEEETSFEEQIGEKKEELHTWNQNNQELKLPQNSMQEINRFLDHFDEKTDYHQVRNLVSDVYFAVRGEKQKQKSQIESRLEQQQDVIAAVTEEMESWMRQKDPEPEVTEAVRTNREHLTKKGIPYHRFYETVEFDMSLEGERADRLEESLLQMGVLDALVIDQSYREQVLCMDPGACDKYLFTDISYQRDNLTNLLTVSEELNDLFGNQQIMSVLGGIGCQADQGTYLCENGTYGIGVLKGTITGTYKARYIGKGARKRYREEQIALLEHKLAEETAVLDGIRAQLQEKAQELQRLEAEYEGLPEGDTLHSQAAQIQEKRRLLENQNSRIRELEAELKARADEIRGLLEQVQKIAEVVYLDCRLDQFTRALEETKEYERQLLDLKSVHAGYLQALAAMENAGEQMENADADMDQIRYELANIKKHIHGDELEAESIRQQLALTNYEEIKEKLDLCLMRLRQIPDEIGSCIKRIADEEHQWKDCQKFLETAEPSLRALEKKVSLLQSNLMKELQLGHTDYTELADSKAEHWNTRINSMKNALASGASKDDSKENLGGKLNQVFYENRGYLLDFSPIMQNVLGEDSSAEYSEINPTRMEITARYRGETVGLLKLLKLLQEEIEDIRNLIKSGDKELFEDILANTIGRKIRSKINASVAWVDHMNQLMESMNTSSGLKLSLRWKSRTAEAEQQLDTRELVDLLKKDARLMTETEFDKLSAHFRSKVEEARRNTRESVQPISFFAIMRDTLDYRKWFEFQLYYQKSGEVKKELTNSIFGTFSGGEKAMSMYVPLFSAVVAKYQGGREDAPRIVSLDEAFAGVDNRNIRDMFRLMSEFQFNFIINSQVLWGDSDTLDGLAIYQLHRLNNQKFVTVMSFVWNGQERKSVMEIRN